jgi:glycosyltransferase involved in cell wall biosynthesis
MGVFGKRLLPLLALCAMPFAALCDELPRTAPKVSVCIPVYNVEPWLPAALDSAINQTMKDIEIICIDDGSTDGSLAILNSYAAKDSRIRVLQNGVNRGLLYARMRAILEAAGNYITWLDSDDELFLDIAEKAYAKAIATGADVVIFNTICYNEKNAAKRNGWHRVKTAETNCAEDSSKLLDVYFNGKISHNCWGKLWKTSSMREMAANLLPFVEKNKIFRAEDAMYFWYALKYVNSYAVLRCNGYKYFEHRGANARNKNDINYRRDVAACLMKIQQKMLDDEGTQEMRDRARRFIHYFDEKILSTAAQLPQMEGFELFGSYLASVPPPYDGEISNKMRRKNRRFFDAYQKYKKHGASAQSR